MQNKASLHHILLFLLLGGMMSFNSCLGCRNASKESLRHSSKYRQSEKERGRRYPTRELDKLDKQAQWKDIEIEAQEGSFTLGDLLQQGKISPDATDQYGRNLIQSVISHDITPDGLKDFLQQLKKQFPNQEIAKEEIAKILNTPDNSSRKDTALIDAIEKMGEKRDKTSIELVDILFENGAKPSLEERKRSLLYCIKLNSLETIETNSGIELFKHLAQKFQAQHADFGKDTALDVASSAAQAGNIDLLQYILDDPTLFPIDVASKSEEGHTLLHVAASNMGKEQRNPAVIQLLLEKLYAANPSIIEQENMKGETASSVAIKHGIYSNVNALLKKGAKVRQQDINMVEDLLKQQPDNQSLRAIQRKLTR